MQRIFFRYSPLLLLVLLTLSCEQKREFDGKLSFYLPEQADFIVRSYDPMDISSELENNSFLSGLQTSTLRPGLTAQIKRFDTLRPEGETWMAWATMNDTVADVVLITRIKTNPAADSLVDNSQSALMSALNDSIKVFSSGQDKLFAVAKGEVVIAGTSRELLLNCLNGPGIEGQQLERLSASLSPERAAVFTKDGLASKLGISNSWKGITLDLQPDAFGFAGISRETDSTLVWQSNTFGLPTSLNGAKLVPANSSFLIERSYKTSDTTFDSTRQSFASQLLDQSSAYGYLETTKGNALLIRAIDTLNFQEAIDPYSVAGETFRDIKRYTLNDPVVFGATLDEWVKIDSLDQFFKLNDTYVFSSDNQTAEDIISSFKSNNTLAERPDYKAIDSRLSDGAHMRISGTPTKILPYLEAQQSGVLGYEPELNNTQAHRLLTIQFTKDNEILYLQGQTVLEQSEAPAAGIRELKSIALEEAPLAPPIWFTNHRSKGKDIVYQDVENKLHLLAYNGRSLWSRDLDGPILGQVKEVDLLRNGKKQLAFTTAGKLYVIDRNGNDVAPFPINFKDEVTLPLAVFDYDNNRKYRFVIVQDKNILMYDSKAKIVKGFTFTKASTTIQMPPQHLRIGNKDYLTFALADGRLLIKSRVGKDRITVNKNFEFGASPIYTEQGNFVFISGQGTKVTIDSKGGVSEKDLGVAQGFSLVIKGNTKVSLDENLLRINGRLYELPFGVYSPPQIYQLGRSRYVTLTDLQEKQVYIFNSSGDLLPNFPVYGSGPSAIGDANRNRRANLLTMSDPTTCLIYEF